MSRFKCIVEYDGKKFCGWQSQPHRNTVQQCIETALQKIIKKKIKIFGSGRTDSGVHAIGQVFHFDYDGRIQAFKILEGTNHFLKKKNISIIKVQKVKKKFNSRKNAILRIYHYIIINRKSNLSLMNGRAWHVKKKLDIKKMQNAAKLFLGKHDFTTFRSKSCNAKSPIKTIEYSRIKKSDKKITYVVKSRSFLQHQVRSMIGAIKYVGEGKWNIDDLKKAIEKKNRNSCPPVAPPCGLYLFKVQY